MTAPNAVARAGIYRFAFCLSSNTYARRFGNPPARPPKGGVVQLPDDDPTRRNELMPHPISAWMRWGQILAPTAGQFESLRPLLTESLELVRARWQRRTVA